MTPNPLLTDTPLLESLTTWLLVTAAVGISGFVLFGFVLGLVYKSFGVGYGRAYRLLRELIGDILGLSPRRIWAIAWHGVLESIRRRVILVMVFFSLLFLFAGWFLPTRPTEHVRVYVSFVMMSSMLISVVLMGVLTATSLPNDIRFQTIHTIVTKPVRRLEILIGRLIGFSVVATLVLSAMGIFGYFWILRSVSSTKSILASQIERAERDGNDEQVFKLKDDLDQIDSKLTARVPVMGELVFLDREGQEKTEGKSVGEESTRRGYIAGNTPEAAVWKFTDIPMEELMARGEIQFELTFSVFRTHKGIMGQGVASELTFKNPKTGVQFTDLAFEVREFYVNKAVFRDDPGDPADPDDDRTVAKLLEGCEGELHVEARCLSSAQYLGMGQPDLYVLMDNASFGLNFVKGMIGVWLRVLLIITVAIMLSTFLSGPVTILATISVLIGGMTMPFLTDLVQGDIMGGGPIEALIRIYTHENLQRDLGNELNIQAAQSVDVVLLRIIEGLTYVIPDLGLYNTTPLVANGFDIKPVALINLMVRAVGYLLPFLVAGYFFLQSREIAR